MFRSLLFLIVWALFTFVVSAGNNSPADVQIIVNGRSHTGIDFRIISARVMVPVHRLFEAAAFLVEWSGETRQIRLVRGPKEVILWIHSNQARVDGVVRRVQVPPRLIGGRVFVPLRFIGEAFGAVVDWGSSNRVVSITFPDESRQPLAMRQPVPTPPKGAIEGGLVASIELGGPSPRIVIRGAVVDRTFIIVSETTFHRQDLNTGRRVVITPQQVFVGDLVMLSVEVGGGALRGIVRRLEVLVREETGFVQSAEAGTVRLTSGKSFGLAKSVRISERGAILSIENLRPGTNVVLRINPKTGEVTEVEVV